MSCVDFLLICQVTSNIPDFRIIMVLDNIFHLMFFPQLFLRLGYVMSFKFSSAETELNLFDLPVHE
jgi:hypothetical protein